MTLRSVVLAGGGTGGHIYPLLAFADCLRRHDPAIRITCLGTPKGLETELIPAAGYDLRHVPAYQLPRSVNMDLVRTPDRMWRSARAARQGPRRGRRPTSWSASAATSRCRPTWPPGGGSTPMVIHEVNVPPGVANRLGMRFTKHVAVGFPHQPGSPGAARRAGWSGCRCAGRSPPWTAAARGPRRARTSGWTRDRPTLFVFGALAGRPLDQPGGGRGGQGDHRGRRPGAARDRRPQRGRRDADRPARART